ncbi:DUF1616 domain-containing protein [Haladaptatus sp. DYSN1]|uniref:DUF1616 domain-containing protein n=1 Tax=unclassified Haladaptatus TaxID=2622732 RepID=UPI002404FED5|nr:DUF1616 domain-containing protein [Haladaptatus sp. DYSN1]
MVSRRELLLFIPRPVRHFLTDLAAVVVLIVLAGVGIFVPGFRETPLQVVLGLPLALFLPGYALIAALFPRASAPLDAAEETNDANTTFSTPLRWRQKRGLTGLERLVLSFGFSAALVPVIGLILNFSPWGIRVVPYFLAVSGFTLLATVVAAYRRGQLSAEARFTVPFGAWAATVYATIQPSSRTDALVNTIVALAVVAAFVSVSLAVAVPNQSEAFSEFYLLTETADGERIAGNFPTRFTSGEPRTVIVGIENHEQRTMDYTVVVALQRVNATNNTTAIIEEAVLAERRVPSLEDGETWESDFELSPVMTGDRLRLLFLLYEGDPPATPTAENADLTMHLWVTVTAENSALDPPVGVVSGTWLQATPRYSPV